jgi:hypothetical protein
MGKLFISIFLVLSVFLSSCDHTDDEFQENCEKTIEKNVLLALARCDIDYTAGTPDHDDCLENVKAYYMGIMGECE